MKKYHLPTLIDQNNLANFSKINQEIKDHLFFLNKQAFIIKIKNYLNDYNNNNKEKIKSFYFSFTSEYDDRGGYFTCSNATPQFVNEDDENNDIQYTISDNLVDILGFHFDNDTASEILNDKRINIKTCEKDLMKLLFNKEEMNLIDSAKTKLEIENKVNKKNINSSPHHKKI